MSQAPTPPPHAPQPYAQAPYPTQQAPYPPQLYAQPPYATPQHGGPLSGIPMGTWSSGLCDCLDDCHNSCESSGAMYCLIASVTGHAWIYSCFYRSKLRAQYGLPESPCPDCLVHCCCEWCALCQEYRELKARGFDMSKGWEENQENQRREMAMAPIAQGGMTK